MQTSPKPTCHNVDTPNKRVVAFTSPGMERAVDYCGSHSGRDVDKTADTELEVLPVAEVGAPLIKGATVNLEYRLAGSLRSADHTIFAGEVVVAHIEERVQARLVNFGGDHIAVAEPAVSGK